MTVEDELMAQLNAGVKYCVDNSIIIEKAIASNVDAESLLGRLYLYEYYGFPRDINKAKYWFEKASNKGDIESTYNLGQIYLTEAGSYSTESQDTLTAVNLFTKAANAGHPAAKRRIGISYLYGLQHQKNIALGISILEEAAELGDAVAQDTIGSKYYHGISVEKDFIKAEKYLRAAAEQDVRNSCTTLGCLLWEKNGYFRNENSTNDFSKDIKTLILFKDYEGIKKIANAFNSDWGIDAYENFKKAVELGESEEFGAEYYLGLCYKFGLGTKQDISLGQNYLLRAYNIAINADYPCHDIERALEFKFDNGDS